MTTPPPRPPAKAQPETYQSVGCGMPTAMPLLLLAAVLLTAIVWKVILT